MGRKYKLDRQKVERLARNARENADWAEKRSAEAARRGDKREASKRADGAAYHREIQRILDRKLRNDNLWFE